MGSSATSGTSAALRLSSSNSRTPSGSFCQRAPPSAQAPRKPSRRDVASEAAYVASRRCLDPIRLRSCSRRGNRRRRRDKDLRFRRKGGLPWAPQPGVACAESRRVRACRGGPRLAGRRRWRFHHSECGRAPPPRESANTRLRRKAPRQASHAHPAAAALPPCRRAEGGFLRRSSQCPMQADEAGNLHMPHKPRDLLTCPRGDDHSKSHSLPVGALGQRRRGDIRFPSELRSCWDRDRHSQMALQLTKPNRRQN